MNNENLTQDNKSLRTFTGKNVDWSEYAKDCVAFANAQGGALFIGIEDHETQPPAGQKIPANLPEVLQKRARELCVNVQVVSTIVQRSNGGEVLELRIVRADHVASTADGRYYLRVADACVPITGDDVLRLANERSGFPWESAESPTALRDASTAEIQDLLERLRKSDRVNSSIKHKSDSEILVHYGLLHKKHLTRLGALLVGGAFARRALGTAPIVQAIRYDERQQKINKWSWDDHTLSPIALIDSIWKEVSDFRESYEVAEGMFRKSIPAYDERVIRELLVNALVHRPYTQQGDIFINLYPDSLSIVNPGRLPIGVTPSNILHASRRRNEGLAKVFQDIGLMEREGSGFDMIYDRLLSQGKPIPQTVEGPDRVQVTIQRRILKLEAMQLIERADSQYQLTQRERIALGVLALQESLTTRQLAEILVADSASDVSIWLGRLPALGLVEKMGKTNALRYFVPPKILRSAKLDKKTSLTRIEPHRLQELIREDLRRYPESNISDIHRRIGPEIAIRTVRTAIQKLVAQLEITPQGKNRWSKYSLK